jgi:hypothetical protein
LHWGARCNRHRKKRCGGRSARMLPLVWKSKEGGLFWWREWAYWVNVFHVHGEWIDLGTGGVQFNRKSRTILGGGEGPKGKANWHLREEYVTSSRWTDTWDSRVGMVSADSTIGLQLPTVWEPGWERKERKRDGESTLSSNCQRTRPSSGMSA